MLAQIITMMYLIVYFIHVCVCACVCVSEKNDSRRLLYHDRALVLPVNENIVILIGLELNLKVCCKVEGNLKK